LAGNAPQFTFQPGDDNLTYYVSAIAGNPAPAIDLNSPAFPLRRKWSDPRIAGSRFDDARHGICPGSGDFHCKLTGNRIFHETIDNMPQTPVTGINISPYICRVVFQSKS
jgi:hypothetical protein